MNTDFQSPLANGIRAFLHHKRALGKRMEKPELVFRMLDRFLVAHSPVRGSEPHMAEDIKSFPKIVGGRDLESTEKAVKFYRASGINPIEVACPRVSELFKLAGGGGPVASGAHDEVPRAHPGSYLGPRAP